MNRLSPSSGIAIGPILFVLALLGILASVFSAGMGGSLGQAGNADRITTDIVGQVNLIRSKIIECHTQYLINAATYATGCSGDPYPCSDGTNGTNVADLTCPNDPLNSGNERSLWTGLRPATYPPATSGFAEWKYMNAGDSGGRCIWTAPNSGSSSAAAVEGLKRAATKFTSQELSYDGAAAAQKFVVFITPPSGAVHSNCALP